MDQIFKFHAGSKTVIIFKKHFAEGGSLYNTKISGVINKKTSDDKIVYDGDHCNVYLDCTEDVLMKIANKTYETDELYFSKLKQAGGKLLEIELSEDSQDSHDMEKLFQNIDTVASPTNNNAMSYGGDNSEIDDLVNNIHDKLSNDDDQYSMKDILQILKEGAGNNTMVNTTTELKTDVEYNSRVKSQYLDLN